MQTVIDRHGRIVIPKTIRDDLGLNPGAKIDIIEEKDNVIIKPVDIPNPLKRKKKVVVFCGKANSTLKESVSRTRDSRIGKFHNGIDS